MFMYQLLGLNTADRIMANTIGEQVLYEAANQELAMHQAELDRMAGVFVERTTTNYTERYKLAGNGRLQRRGNQTQSAVVDGRRGWDVAFPLESWGDQIAADRITDAYSTLQDVDLAMTTVANRNAATVRHEILFSLFNNTARSFTDPTARTSTLTIQPLANGDATLYPPVRGTDTGATADRYSTSGYASAAISNTNDPVRTAVNNLQSHFGAMTGGSQIVVFHNMDETTALEGLDATKELPDRFVASGANVDVATAGYPVTPGKMHARHTAGAWLCEWEWIPSGYMLGIHTGAPSPLVRRVHPAFTNIPQGLHLAADANVGDKYPFSQAHYEHHFGYGVGNRLNGHIMQLDAGPTYAIPADFA